MDSPDDLTPRITIKIVGLQGQELPPGVYTAEITNTRELRGGRRDGDIAIRAKLFSPFPYPTEVE